MKTVKCVLFVVLTLFFVLLSCCRRESSVQSKDNVVVDENVKDSALDSVDQIADTVPALSAVDEAALEEMRQLQELIAESHKPVSEADLKEWKKWVREKASIYHYNLLENYFANHPDPHDEMLEYTPIIIDEHGIGGAPSLAYYSYVEESNSPDKDKLMVKAIGYLEELAKEEDDITTVQARGFLARVYRDGVYVPRDTVIADYFGSGGRNVDSIKQARSSTQEQD